MKALLIPVLPLIAMFGPHAASGQPILPAAADGSAQSAPAQGGASSQQPGFHSRLSSAFGSSLPLMKWGPVAVRPHLLYSIVSADGLLNSTQPEDPSSVIQTVASGVLLEIGQRWTVNYTLAKTYHSNPLFGDDVSHDAAQTGEFSHGKWTFGLSQRYRSGSPIMVETAQQTPQYNYLADLSVSYQIGERTHLSSSVTHNIRHIDEAIVLDPEWTTTNWSSWSTTDMLHYAVSKRISVAAGVVVGYDRISRSPDMYHTEPQAQLKWSVTEKLSLDAKVGAESRTIKKSAIADFKNPVYSGSLQYAPIESTTLTYATSRSFSASYFANQAIKTSTWSVGWQQRLFHSAFLTANYGRQTTDYLPTSAIFLPDRRDTNESVGLRLSTRILVRGAISVFYDHGNNVSNITGFSLNSRQVGAEISYNF